MDFTPDKMRARFHELEKKLKKHVDDLQPTRDKRDKLAAQNAVEIDKLGKQIKAAQAPMVDIEMEMAALARALGGKTSAPE